MKSIAGAVLGLGVIVGLGAGTELKAHGDTLEIKEDTTLDSAKTYGAIVITKSGVTIDGKGATLLGASKGDPKTFEGVAISAKGVSGVVLKNVKARGWETGLSVQDGDGWTIENCDFSDNFHDPEFGWGENGRRGGIVLERVRRSTIRKNRANRVWDACVLADSDENTIVDNDFSHTSNTCMKLWHASRNTVARNNLSYGLRIKEGEVHARDSTSVLIESGSNENHFDGNDCTHGGDGIFIRVLNGWVSTGNVLENNDVSYANNNGFEAWSPRNTYRHNKANHCSYGFWLGASDQSVVEENEASYNGVPEGFHNSPHLPKDGHAGITFIFGPSSHTIVRGNRCVGNNGAGIALEGDRESKGKKWRAFHWIIEDNALIDNRWGIYARFADWIELSGNKFQGNREADIFQQDVTNLARHPDADGKIEPPVAHLEGPSSALVGETVVFDASKSRDKGGGSLAFRWDLGDGTVATEPRVEHTFQQPGFYRLGLTVTNGHSSDLAWRDFYVVEDVPELGTEGSAGRWTWSDPDSKVAFADDPDVRIVGSKSLAASVNPYGGGRVTLVCPAPEGSGSSLEGKTRLVFWIKAINPNLPAWQGPNPLVTLQGLEGASLQLTPDVDLLASPPYIEAREGWTYFQVPIDGDETWKREGNKPSRLKSIGLGFDSWGAPPLRIWIDGMAIE